jgi:hypothetical protein
MKSFVDFGHDYVLYAYRRFDVPAGVVLRDAGEVLPESRVFFYGERAEVGRGSIAGFSNLFRYHLLHRNGDWWVDTDVVCLSETVPASEIFLGWEYEDLIGSAILKFPPAHEFAGALCDAADRAGTDLEWGATGPFLITRLARERGLLPRVSPQPASYPVQSRDAVHLLIPARRDEISVRTQGLPFLHLWNEIWRRAVVFTWMAPPPGSFLAELCERHGIAFGDAPAYTADEVQRLNDNYTTFTYWDWDRRQLASQHEQLVEGQAERARLDEALRDAQARAAALADEVRALQAQLRGRSTAGGGATGRLQRAATRLRGFARILAGKTER